LQRGRAHFVDFSSGNLGDFGTIGDGAPPAKGQM
jgi:hypothetical protein